LGEISQWLEHLLLDTDNRSSAQGAVVSILDDEKMPYAVTRDADVQRLEECVIEQVAL
jgi:hypothetical protein